MHLSLIDTTHPLSSTMPSSLQGLNLVYTPSTNDENKEVYPDISDQLSLWTNVSFVDDSSLSFGNNDTLAALSPTEQTDDTLPHHVSPMNTSSNPLTGAAGSFDLNSFFAGFGIDPFLAPLQPLADTDIPSFSSPPQASPSSVVSPQTDTPASSTADSEAPPSKRPRAAKKQAPAAIRAVSEISDDQDSLSTPLNAAEDKRRRNTAASARFRAKKKEREQAMEKRSKELENRVSELERECEGLRRENGWLKGLVVGVTSGNPANVPPPPADISETKAISREPTKKRKREAGDG